MKKIIWFRTDKLGDFLIHSHLIKKTSESISNSYTIVVCSPYNEKIIKEYDFVNETIAFDKNFRLNHKIRILFKILLSKYYLSVAIDGKKISYFCSFFMNSQSKLGIIYKSKKYIFNKFNITRYKPFFFKSISEKFIFNKVETITGRDSLKEVEHIPSVYIKLFNNFNFKLSKYDPYSFPVKLKSDNIIKELLYKTNFNNYMIIHLDEKWQDILEFNTRSLEFFDIIKKITNKKIVITSYKNNYDYMKNIRKGIKSIKYNDKTNNEIKSSEESNIIHFENFPIFEFERLIFYSDIAISCHAGFVVQVCGTNKTKVMDILNEKDSLWYDCWVPLNTTYKRIFKSKNGKKLSIENIAEQIKINY